MSASGRITSGRIDVGQDLIRITRTGERCAERARYLQIYEALHRVDVEQVEAGEIAMVMGLEDIAIGETLADVENPVALPLIQVEEPTVRMTFAVNTSPLSGSRGSLEHVAPAALAPV